MNLAAGEGWPAPVVFALLMHDLGKGLTPREEGPRHILHEQRGIPLVKTVCERLRAPGAWSELAVKVAGLHLRCHRLMEMKPSSVMRLIEDADLLRRPETLDDFLLACEGDYRGRKGLEDRSYPQAQRLRAALSAAQSVQARDLDLRGLEGKRIGEKLRRARIAAIAGSADPAR